MKTMARITVLVVVVVLLAGGAYAQFAKPEDAIKYRKSVMVLIVTHFKRMGAVVQGKADYDKQAFAANAEVVKMMATLPWEASLTPGSDKGDTTLSPAVFSKRTISGRSPQPSKRKPPSWRKPPWTGILMPSRPRFGVVAQSCKACHKPFRK